MSAALDALKAAALKCTRCGACQSVCPVHSRLFNESASARGKLFLLRSLAENKVEAKEQLAELSATCTLCKSCEARCPSGVKTNELIMALRKELAEQGTLPLVKKLAFAGLTYQRLFDFAMRFGWIFQGLVFKEMADGNGKIARFPIPAAGLDKRRVIPNLAKKPLAALIPKISTVKKPKARVAFFAGCMLNYVYSSAGKDVVSVLNANDIEVVFPENLGCCGTPSFASGDFVHAEALAKHNINILADQKVDAIITACATCGSALAKEYEHILNAGKAKEQWLGFKDKVFDFSQYLEQTGLTGKFTNLPMKVTYHDPCHLVRGMNVAKEPRNILKSIPGLEYVEMKDAAACCGCAGSFSATHYDLSCAINDSKIANTKATGAEMLVTGCSACRMHIQDGLTRNGSTIKVLHTAELLARAYGL